jgi:serine/threonine protein kinase/tetratricopeptide (TPR) repeat protein
MTATADRTESLFAAAVALATPEERAAYLDQACAGDPAVRAGVEALLRAHDRAGHLLDRPALGDAGRTGAYQAPTELPGTVIAGRYKLLEEIGEGGMGTVWVAEQTAPVRRKVALKLVKPGLDSRSVLARFEAERQALALMDHPNIAKVLDGGLTDAGRPFFAMEYVKGVPITEYCDATRLSVTERLQLFVQVCQAVQHAHQKGIIHRDLKPSNILVAPYDDRPVPKVIDFGLAKAMHQSLTERTLHTAHETVLGTPLYMSPEQAQLNNLDVDTRSDIYSLGVLLYELLTGTTPVEKRRFKEAAWDEVRRIIREEEPPRPSKRLSTTRTLPSLAACRHTEPARLTKLVRGELDWIVMKALEKDRSRRYETANGFAMDIQRYLAGEPVLAVPPSTGYRLRKLARKYRAALTVTAAFAVLLVVGTVVSAGLAVRATTAERLARDRLTEVEAAHVQTEHALKGSEQAREQAQAVNQLLMSVFRKASPFQNERPLTVPQLLSQAEASLHSDATLSPGTRASLLAAIGETYESLGSYRDEVRAFEAVRLLRQKHLGPDHADTLKSMHHLAGAYRLAGQFLNAVPLHEEALRRRQATLGPEHPDTLDSMNELARAYRDVGRLTEALPLFKEALRVRRAKLGPDSHDAMLSVTTLATAYEDAGQFEESVQLFEEALRVRLAKLGPDDPNTLWTMYDLAGMYGVVGRLDDALRLSEETLRRRRARLGSDHPLTADTMAQLGRFYLRQRTYAEAEPLLRECLAVYETKLPGTWRVASAQSLLGAALAGRQKYTEAEPPLLAGYEGLKARADSIRAPERTPLLTGALERLVQLYDAWGKPDEAAKWRKELEAVKAAAKPVAGR